MSADLAVQKYLIRMQMKERDREGKIHLFEWLKGKTRNMAQINNSNIGWIGKERYEQEKKKLNSLLKHKNLFS